MGLGSILIAVVKFLLKKEMVEELQDNNLELSDKPLDDGALASLSAMFGDDD